MDTIVIFTPAPGPGGAVTKTYVGAQQDSLGSGSSITLASGDLGSSANGDLLIGISMNSGNLPDFTSVTAAGDALTLVSDGTNSASFTATSARTLWYRGPVSASTGSIVFNFDRTTGLSAIFVSKYRIGGAASLANDVVSGEQNGTLSLSTDVVADGAVFLQFYNYNATAPGTFTNVTADGHLDNATNGADFASALTSSATALSVGASTVNYACAVAVSFAPA